MNVFAKKLIKGANYFVGLIIAITYTLKIDTASIAPHYSDWLMLIILLVFTSMLFGTPLWILSNIAISCSSKSTEVLLDSEAIAVSCASYDAIGVSTAYTMVLYFFGLTDTFFSFASFR